jgi:isopenicillin N synthase-like dioxygenase
LEGVIIVTEAWEERQKARRVLEAAVAEAGGRPDEHVFALPVMRKAGVTNAEFRTAAGYLDEQGWIAGGDGEYETFVVTPEGVDRISGWKGEAPRTEKKEEGPSSSEDDEES